MATAYKVEMKIVSDFINISSQEIEYLLRTYLEKEYSYKETGLKLQIPELKVIKIA